jgi:membrane protein YdbS with pleckstrin-like domain
MSSSDSQLEARNSQLRLAADQPEVADVPGPPGDFRRLDPRVIRVWRLSGAVTWAIILAALLGGAVTAGVLAPRSAPWVALSWIALAALAAWFVYWYPPRAYEAWGYRIDGRALEMRRGRLFRVTRLLPLSRLQHVDLHRGPLERANGLASLVFHTAGTSEASMKVPGLEAEAAVRLRDYLVAVGEGDDAV